MSATALLLFLSLSQTPPRTSLAHDVLLVPVVRPGTVLAPRAAELAAALGDALRDGGFNVLPARPDLPVPLVFETETSPPVEAVAYAGQLEGGTLAVRIEAGELGDRLVLAIEAVDSQTGARVASHSFSRTQGEDTQWAAELGPWMETLRADLRSRTPRPQALPLVLPEPPRVERQVPPAPPPPPARSLRWAALPVAVGGAVVAGSTVALLHSQALHRSLRERTDSPLTGTEARQRALRGQSLQTLAVAGFALGGAAIAGGLAYLIWPVDDGSSMPSAAVSAGPGHLLIRGQF